MSVACLSPSSQHIILWNWITSLISLLLRLCKNKTFRFLGQLKITTDGIAYKQQKFILHNSGSWEVQDQVLVTFKGCILTRWKVGRYLSGASFIKTLILLTWALSSWPNLTSKSPLPSTTTLDIGFQCVIFKRHKHSDHSNLNWFLPSRYVQEKKRDILVSYSNFNWGLCFYFCFYFC